jgi:hypothetical protein
MAKGTICAHCLINCDFVRSFVLETYLLYSQLVLFLTRLRDERKLIRSWALDDQRCSESRGRGREGRLFYLIWIAQITTLLLSPKVPAPQSLSLTGYIHCQTTSRPSSGCCGNHMTCPGPVNSAACLLNLYGIKRPLELMCVVQTGERSLFLARLCVLK